MQVGADVDVRLEAGVEICERPQDFVKLALELAMEGDFFIMPTPDLVDVALVM